jgi:phosphatidylinositol phospholipase C epsilon
MTMPSFRTFQLLHHGTTLVHWECEGGTSRTALVYARVDRACGTFLWEKPSWSSLRTGVTGPGPSIAEYNLSVNLEDGIPNGLVTRYSAQPPDCASVSLEEGHLDLSCVKEVMIGCCDRDRDHDLRAICKRYGLPGSDSCIGLMYGSNLSDNRLIFLLCPPALSKYVLLKLFTYQCCYVM